MFLILIWFPNVRRNDLVYLRRNFFQMKYQIEFQMKFLSSFIWFIIRGHHLDQHRIAVYCPAKKTSMHYNVRLIQWKRRVFRRIQGIVFPNSYVASNNLTIEKQIQRTHTKTTFNWIFLSRYSQLLALRATSKQQHLTQNQMSLLRAQIMAYRSLARNQPLSKQIQAVLSGTPSFDNNSNASNTRRSPPQCPTPPASPYQQPPAGQMQNQQPSSMPPHQQPAGTSNVLSLANFIVHCNEYLNWSSNNLTIV